jgi:hypothetical protein
MINRASSLISVTWCVRGGVGGMRSRWTAFASTTRLCQRLEVAMALKRRSATHQKRVCGI